MANKNTSAFSSAINNNSSNKKNSNSSQVNPSPLSNTNHKSGTFSSLEPEKPPKFQSQDSQCSDISYQSSIQSQQDINIGKIQFFKQQMGRFFINYPQLINHDIIDLQRGYCQQNDEQLEHGYRDSSIRAKDIKIGNNNISHWIDRKSKKDNLNKNWALIADQILNQAKQSTSFLQSLSKRIALYRSKVQQEDLIDILLKQEKNIMKELDLQINLKKKQNKGTKNTENMEGVQNMYFSWRKKKEMENRLNLIKEDNTSDRKNLHLDSKSIPKASSSHQKKYDSETKFKKLDPSNYDRRSQFRKDSNLRNTKVGSFFITGNNEDPRDSAVNFGQKQSYNKTFGQRNSNMLSKSNSVNTKHHRSHFSLNKNNPLDKLNSSTDGLQKQNRPNQPTPTYWKHLINFEPRTEAGRQLCQLIRKTNNPNDELGIKKTIMTFLSRSKEMVQNEIILKSTISQKIQKLYNDDSKQLLMFYPTKMTNLNINTNNTSSNLLSSNNQNKDLAASKQQGMENSNNTNSSKFQSTNNRNSSNTLDENHKLYEEGEKFLQVLEDIVEGPLMKYWTSIQESKL